MEMCSVYVDSRREVDVFKWIESEKVGYDLGEIAIRRWVQQHWNGYLRARWLEHLQGNRFWVELDRGDFGLFHLIDAASSIEPGTEGGKPGGSPTIVVTWTLRSQKAWVRMDIRPPQTDSAFSTYLKKHERVFRNYKCPRIVAAGVR